MKTKICNRCGTERTLTRFSPQKGGKYGRHGVCKDCRRIEANEKYASDPEFRTKQLARSYRHQLSVYGITENEYRQLLEYQNGRCAICEKVITGRQVHVDHDHRTNKVRGILCAGCNTSLGKFGDDREGVLKVLGYLDCPPARWLGVGREHGETVSGLASPSCAS